MQKCFCKTVLFVCFAVVLQQPVYAQRYLSDLDTSHFIRDTLRPFIKKFENLYLSGYIQPQFQVASEKGAPSFAGGNFSQFASSRFMLRRARIKVDFNLPSDKLLPKAAFTFQIDATERGVFVRDMFARIFGTGKQYFSLTTGLFARPFGYEVNLSSAFRETPERGRMSQILMPTERDLGLMLSYEPHAADKSTGLFKLDAGFFNGQGLSGTSEFDSYKDFISRITMRPVNAGPFYFSGGLSFLNGGWRQGSPVFYTMHHSLKDFVKDSAISNIGRKAPRRYFGGDIQWKWLYDWGETELRAEYWWGIQPGTALSTLNPGTPPVDNNNVPLPVYQRRFNGAFFYFLQHIINRHHQLLLKYDWYDPNRQVRAQEIGNLNKHFTTADIRYATVGMGYAHYFNEHLKLILYYDLVRNENTLLQGYTADRRDDVFTCRLQVKF